MIRFMKERACVKYSSQIKEDDLLMPKDLADRYHENDSCTE